MGRCPGHEGPLLATTHRPGDLGGDASAGLHHLHQLDHETGGSTGSAGRPVARVGQHGLRGVELGDDLVTLGLLLVVERRGRLIAELGAALLQLGRPGRDGGEALARLQRGPHRALHRLEERLAVGAEVGLAAHGDELGLGRDLEVEEDTLLLELLRASARLVERQRRLRLGVEPERRDQAGVRPLRVVGGGESLAAHLAHGGEEVVEGRVPRGVRLALRHVRGRRAARRRGDADHQEQDREPHSPHWSTAPHSS